MLKYHPLGLIFILFIFFGNELLGQTRDPQDLKSKQAIFSHQYSYLADDNYYFIDTLFDNLKEYHKWNNANKDLFHYSSIGSMGMALNPLTFKKETNLWSNYDFKGYNSYFLEQDQVKYYDVKSPLTQANYWMGYDVGQKFQIYHTQNINDNWNFLIDYSRLNDLGSYTNNLTKQVNFLASSKYLSENGRYRAYFNFFNQNLHIEENGGIANDSIFEQNIESNRNLFLVNLNNDSRSMRNQEFFLNQELNFNKGANDSIDSIVSVRTNNSLWIGHDFTYSRRSDTYRGSANDGYYSNYYNGITTYLDSSFYTSYTNTVYLRTKLESLNDFELKLGARSIVYSYGADGFLINGSALGLVSNLYGRIGKFQIKSKLDYILTGNLRESVDFTSSGDLKLFNTGSARVSYNLNSSYPNFFQQVNYSDNFIWNNDLRKVNTNEVAFKLSWMRVNGIKISNTTIGNFTYYDEQVLPKQHDALLNLLKIELDQNFRFWNFLHFDNKVIYQVVNKKGGEVMPLPEIVSRNSLYFEFPLFKNALKCLVGAEVKYFSKYKTPSYIPAIGDFAVQNEREIGDFPIFDVFANFKIRSATLFFKFEHVNQGLNSYSYYAAPHYPFPDRIFRVGISWRFFN